MKTSILASLAFAAALVPSLAGAANLTYDPSAGSNDPRFVEQTVGSVSAEAPKASTAFVTAYDPSAGNNDPRFVTADAAKADAPVLGTHDAAAARFSTSYDPSADTNHPRFR